MTGEQLDKQLTLVQRLQALNIIEVLLVAALVASELRASCG